MHETVIQTCDGAGYDLVWEVGEDEDPGESDCHQHRGVEQVRSSWQHQSGKEKR